MTGSLLGVVVTDEMAPHVSTACRGYVRALAAIDRPAPPGFDAFVAAVERVATSGQLGGERCDRAHDQLVPALLTVDETAAMLRVSTRTVRRRLHDGTIRSTRLGRRHLISRRAVLRVIEAAS